jgi:hypothetical protein
MLRRWKIFPRRSLDATLGCDSERRSLSHTPPSLTPDGSFTLQSPWRLHRPAVTVNTIPFPRVSCDFSRMAWSQSTLVFTDWSLFTHIFPRIRGS